MHSNIQYMLMELLILSAALSWSSPLILSGFVTCLAYGAAAVWGYVHPLGLLAVALSMSLAHLSGRYYREPQSAVFHLAFICLGILLSVHLLPGFSNPVLIRPIQFTSDAYPFKMYLNLDKAAVGLSIFLLYEPLHKTSRISQSLLWAAIGTIAGTVALVPPALITDVVVWAPKMPREFGLWALNNLFLVAFTEEALFRGFLQANLARVLHKFSASEWIALGVASVAFGFLHYSGGPIMIVFASIAGAIYGTVYRHGGVLASTLAHFGFNVIHFLLFTYPLRLLTLPD
ncbi:CPBP family intramembrane glutamic endopeptidase [Hyphomicrobium sp. MC1]|uniref:CPBP family intramembrane glutamic endopeptidase n=1 Tax=Hyphomicrobium sp. (strain MC1) TaxID=717785 RepID=UPI0012F50EDA|nr:CPBP family intramembrane glutamic endopeptidase [Hyphomicrobium sp. MC1]